MRSQSRGSVIHRSNLILKSRGASSPCSAESAPETANLWALNPKRWSCVTLYFALWRNTDYVDCSVVVLWQTVALRGSTPPSNPSSFRWPTRDSSPTGFHVICVLIQLYIYDSNSVIDMMAATRIARVNVLMTAQSESESQCPHQFVQMHDRIGPYSMHSSYARRI